jgi:hypothetical protein
VVRGGEKEHGRNWWEAVNGRRRSSGQKGAWWSGAEPSHGRDDGSSPARGSWRWPGPEEGGLKVEVTSLADGADARGAGFEWLYRAVASRVIVVWSDGRQRRKLGGG